jgi:hypothetical protein
MENIKKLRMSERIRKTTWLNLMFAIAISVISIGLFWSNQDIKRNEKNTKNPFSETSPDNAAVKQQTEVAVAKKDLENFRIKLEGSERGTENREAIAVISNIRVDLQSAFRDASYETTVTWLDADKQLENVEKDLLAGIITPSDAIEKVEETLEKEVQYDS